MIPATVPFEAVFQPAPVPFPSAIPVVAWQADGVPLVMGREYVLVDARSLDGFQCVRMRLEFPVTAALPGGGWQVHWQDGTTEPITYWLIRANGVPTPVVVEGDGHPVEVSAGYTSMPFEILPPEVPA